MTSELIIFDCDGVLIDSEVIACRVEADVLGQHGLPYDEAEILRRFCGIPPPAMYALMEDETGLKVSDEVRAMIRTRIRERIATELVAIPGVSEVLELVRRRRCVASSSSLGYLARVLNQVGLHRHFHPHIFSAQQVANGKPAPDLFLFAASRMGVDPRHCLVIEDSVAGVQAGRAAGMRVIGFAGGGHCRDGHDQRLRAEGAEQVLNRMADLPALLNGLG